CSRPNTPKLQYTRTNDSTPSLGYPLSGTPYLSYDILRVSPVSVFLTVLIFCPGVLYRMLILEAPCIFQLHFPSRVFRPLLSCSGL
ncbi:hypothetical protein K439DRAFT_1629822, partial [Ramaria rubella]